MKFKNKKNTILLGILAILVIILLIKGSAHNDSFVFNNDGSIKAINKEGISKSQTFSLELELIQGKNHHKEKVNLQLSGREESEDTIGKQQKNNKKILEDKIKDIIWAIEETTGETVYLPKEIQGKIKLVWREQKKSYYSIFIIIGAFLIIALKFDKKKKKTANSAKEKFIITQSLPCFINKIILLLNSGLILNDVFLEIEKEYGNRNEIDKNCFTKSIEKIVREQRNSNRNIIIALNDYGRKSGVKELSRITNIIYDSYFKGIGLVDRLENERELIWNNRKKLAEERGKLAETKMAFPLGLLLIVLIVITAAPAMLQMKE